MSEQFSKDMSFFFRKTTSGFPKYRKLFVRPFLYIQNSIGTETATVLFLLSVQIVLLLISRSMKAVLVISAAAAGSVLANAISRKAVSVKSDRCFSYPISLVQGIIAGMLVPEVYPPLTVLVITLCTMIVAKHFFGGFSYSIANPSLLAVAAMWIIGARVFGVSELSLDLLAARNPSQTLIENGIFPAVQFDGSVTEALNNSVFSLFKVSIPDGYVSLFWDTRSVIPAFRFNFVTLISSVIIFSMDSMKIIVPGCFAAVYVILVRFLSPVFFHGIAFQGDMLLALLTGGTLFFAAFVINWYGTVPASVKGKIVCGISAGIIAFFVSGCGTSPCGMTFTVIIVNFISLIVQHYENSSNYKCTKKMVENIFSQEEK